MRNHQWVVRSSFIRDTDLGLFSQVQYARTKGDAILYVSKLFDLDWAQRYELARAHRLVLPLHFGDERFGDGRIAREITLGRISCPWGTCSVCGRSVRVLQDDLTVACPCLGKWV